MVEKRGARLLLTSKEFEILDKLKVVFDKGSRNAVVYHLINLADKNYLEHKKGYKFIKR